MTNSINFGGIHCAKCKGFTKKGEEAVIDFYKITAKDKDLIEGISKIRTEGLTTPVLMSTSHANHADEYDVFIAVHDKKPIGIVSASTYHDNDKKTLFSYLHGIATWGTDKKLFSKDRQNKIQNTGQGLMNLIFARAKDQNLDTVKLTSVQESGPFYSKIGFKTIKNDLLKRAFLLTTAKEMEYKLTPELVDKRVKDIDMNFTNSNNDISLDFLDRSFDTSGFQDSLKNTATRIKKTLIGK